MKTSTILILAIYFGFALIELWRTGLFSKAEQTRGDGIVEAVSTIVLLFVTQPFILFSSVWLAGQIMPEQAGALAGIPILAALALFIVFDDMMQYWWHRAAHTFPLLYKLHRPHHDGRYMSIRLVYRNNIFYYLTMPGIWFSGVLIYLGLGYVYAGYIVVKLAVIIGAHSDVAWDKPLYKIAWLSPVMWVVERTISTPSTHHAHHGRHKDDGVTNYKGNFGNLLFFWDVLFGTAKITRRYPTLFGVENLPATSTGEMLLWPIISTGNSAKVEDPPVTAPAA